MPEQTMPNESTNPGAPPASEPDLTPEAQKEIEKTQQVVNSILAKPEETPVEETPVEETPVEETPVEAPPTYLRAGPQGSTEVVRRDTGEVVDRSFPSPSDE